MLAILNWDFFFIWYGIEFVVWLYCLSVIAAFWGCCSDAKKPMCCHKTQTQSRQVTQCRWLSPRCVDLVFLLRWSDFVTCSC